jgi:hypothetical protein
MLNNTVQIRLDGDCRPAEHLSMLEDQLGVGAA